MSMTITIGWWVIPAAITVLGLTLPFVFAPRPHHSSYGPDVGSAVIGFAYLCFGVIVSLAAWLIWALVF